MKKSMLVFCSLLMFLAVFAPGAFALSEEKPVSPESVIEIVKPYVDVTEDGKIQFKDVPQGFYDKYNLTGLQKHFDKLNALAQKDYIVINDDLSIVNNEITPFTVYGQWTYYWWGYDRYFTNQQTLDAIDYYNTVAAGGALITGATAWLPAISGFTGATSGYFYLLATRFSANNNGNGVYAAVTWLAIFDIKPL
ncbi:hypothetical protein M5X00_00095 [Paenibacillus alvei]|uniref:Surface antigen n=1 Tax=Paenibacillus alvei TaxID=44250 RepID=A0ABT4H1C7_PAEAL|nr:hypothetical protein [Paenibacillus alvei]EJW20340.1 surface antigen [Paenibacillus alvei DSM 29]MCY7488147.1 hypothetical protein [Paenibacillus alvei]MCY9540267.1 hypothetical protein [Paenibacillus alvei]MCY9705791.1 hypothetical protein [Paenibacillus alvei]MCY9738295.1 hypothetical protein [Paenibacillus alvei]